MDAGGAFINTKTNERIEYTTRLHLRYFISNQEKMFSIVVVICIAMSIVLTGFLMYHLKLATSNTTTNEDYKKDDFYISVQKEKQILEMILKKAEDWHPAPDATSQEMPKISVDNKPLPRSKPARLQKLNDMIKDCDVRLSKLYAKSPYQPK